MKTGKISESILKRSVLKMCGNKREEVINGAGVGEDCAFFSFSPKDVMASCVHTVEVHTPFDVKRGIYRILNNFAVSNAEGISILLNFFLPTDSYESDLKQYMKEAEKLSKEYDFEIAGGHTEVSSQVKTTILSITGIGIAQRESIKTAKNVKPGQDVVLSKWIGLEGTSLLAKEKEDELKERYPAYFIEEAKGYNQYIPILSEAAIAVKSGVCAMHDGSQGGIFRALWELAEGADVGLDLDLKKIPIKQETVEICEFLKINPYELLSGGCLIMTTENGYDLVRVLNQEGIPAVVVGKITEGHDRIVRKDEEIRFLDRPKGDQLQEIIK